MPRSKPPFYKQEKQYSCVPACLRTVLSAFGVNVSESELRELCDTTIFGATALKAVDAARTLDFKKSARYNLTMEELLAVIEAGNFPIVLVNLLPVSSKDAAHAYVVIEASAADITVYDPAYGERTLPARNIPRGMGNHAQCRDHSRHVVATRDQSV